MDVEKSLAVPSPFMMNGFHAVGSAGFMATG
jgi:hypothetical protein